MDIAQIGFAADTSNLDKAKTSLNALVPAAASVEKASENVSAAMGDVTKSAAVMNAAVTKTASIVDLASARMTQGSTAVKKIAGDFKQFADVQDRINRTTGVSGSNNNSKGRGDDIAAYGQQMDALRSKYNPLYAAGQTYKAQLSDINKAYVVGAISTKEHADAITKTKSAFVDEVKALKDGTNAANDNAHAHGGMSTQAMAAQHSIRSMVEMLAMGMPPTQILSAQMNHLSYAASGPGGLKQAFTEAFGPVAKFLSVSVLVGAGIGAAILGFAAYAGSVVKSTIALDDFAKSIDLTLAKAHQLQQAASFKGISNDDFTAGLQGFAKNVDDAQHNTGSLNGLMIASGKSAKDLEGYLINVADIVSQTASGIQKRNILEAAGLPTTQQWVNFLSQGGKAIQDAMNDTRGYNDAAEKNLVQKARDFDDAWNKATTNVSNYLKSIVIDNLDWIQKAIQIAALLRQISAGFTVAGGASTKGALNPLKEASFSDRFDMSGSQPTGNANALQKALNSRVQPDHGNDNQQTQAQLLAANQQAQQRVSILGDLATIEQQVAAKQLQLNASALQGIGVSKDMATAILNETRAQAEMSKVQQQATAGVYSETLARKAAADTLQSWIDKGLVDKTNAEQMAAAHQVLANQIDQSSKSAELAGAKFQALKQIEQQGSDFAKLLDTSVAGALNNLVTPIEDVMNHVTTLKNGFASAGTVILKAIQNMIIQMLILKPIAASLQGMFGGMNTSSAGGFLASLFGGGNGTVPGAIGPSSLGGAPLIANALGGAYNSPSLSAYSGRIVSSPTLFKFASGAGLMGEAGPEGILPLKRGTNGSLGVQMYGSNDNSSGTSVHYNPQYTIASDVSKRDIAELKKAQAEQQRNFVANVHIANRQLTKRNYR